MHFVYPVTGRAIRRTSAWVLFLSGIAGLGCSPRSTPRPVEDSQTSGRISMVCASEAGALMAREREAFQTLYPDARIDQRDSTSRDAIRALFAAEGDVAVITRDLAPEERAAAVRGRLELEGYRFARDAVVMVVHPGNPIENISVEDVRKIYEGSRVRWS